MKRLFLLVPFAALMTALLSAAPTPRQNADLTFNPNPPVAGENLEINLEWTFYEGDEIEVVISFQPASGGFSDVTIKIPRGGKGVIAIPKGATGVTARDKSHQANKATGKVTQ